MAFPAGIRIEQWAEPILRFEDSLESSLSRQELGLLIGRETGQGFSQRRLVRRRFASPKQKSQQHRAYDSFRIHRFLSFG